MPLACNGLGSALGLACLAVALAGCASTTREVPARTVSIPSAAPSTAHAAQRASHDRAGVTTEGNVDVTVALPQGATAPPPRPAVPSGVAPPDALDRVRAQLDAQAGATLTATESAWIPFRALREVYRASNELPAPAAPVVRDNRVLWSLVATTRGLDNPAARAGICDALSVGEPRVACAIDAVSTGALLRTRIALGWRAEPPGPQNPRYAPDLATPLRALSLSSQPGVCVRALQKTARSLELELCAPDARALGVTLALLTAAPGLSDAVLLRAEPAPCGLQAHIAWPLDRAQSDRGSLGDEAWPLRCDDRPMMAAELPRGTVPDAVARIDGARAQGALVRVLDRAYLLTEGDRVAGYTITGISPRGVHLLRDPPTSAARGRPGPARGRPLLRPFPPAQGIATAPARSPSPVRIALPPEPPAASSPLP